MKGVRICSSPASPTGSLAALRVGDTETFALRDAADAADERFVWFGGQKEIGTGGFGQPINIDDRSLGQQFANALSQRRIERLAAGMDGVERDAAEQRRHRACVRRQYPAQHGRNEGRIRDAALGEIG